MLEIFLIKTLRRKGLLDLLYKIYSEEADYYKTKKKELYYSLRIGIQAGLIKMKEDHKNYKNIVEFTEIGNQIFERIHSYTTEIKSLNKIDIEIIQFFSKLNNNQINSVELLNNLYFSKKTVLKHIENILNLGFLRKNNGLLEFSKKGRQFWQTIDNISDILYENSNFKHGLPIIHYLIINNLVEAGILHLLRHEELGRTTITNMCKSLFLPRDTVLRVVKRMGKKQLINLSENKKIVFSNNLTEQYQLTLDIIIVSNVLLSKYSNSVPNVRGKILKHIQELIDLKEETS